MIQQIDKSKIRKWNQDPKFNTEVMLPVSEIRSNTVILKDGWLRGIIKVFGLNLDLRNYEEKQIVIEQYKRFLNWLDFPVQIFVRSTYLDLTEYIEYTKENVAKLDNNVLLSQWNQYVWFLDDINSKQWLIYTKEFYIIVPYYPLEDDTKNVRKPWWQKFLNALDWVDSPEKIVYRYRQFMKNRKGLDTRCTLVMEWLKWLWLFAERLDLADLVSLLFRVYNPLAHKQQSEITEN